MTECFRMECDCNMYEESMLFIDSCIEIAFVHGFKVDKFITFKYCPWCGKELTKIPIPSTMSQHEAQKRSYNMHRHIVSDRSLWKSFFEE